MRRKEALLVTAVTTKDGNKSEARVPREDGDREQG